MENSKEEQGTDSRHVAIKWWNNLPTSDRYVLLRKHGYQDQEKPWKYRPLSDKGIYLIWCNESELNRQTALW